MAAGSIKGITCPVSCADKFMLVAGLWTDGCAAIRGNEAKLKKLT
jgi:hypothetical protein